MAKAGPLCSTIPNRAIVAALLLLGSCARPSPELPPDLSRLPPAQRLLPGDLESPEAQLDCSALKAQIEGNRTKATELGGVIVSHRQQNQAAGYIAGVLFPPALLAVKSDTDIKQTLDELQRQSDRLDRLSVAKGC
jgi:hypothetical protein